MLTFEIPGRPKAKERPRNGRGHTYTPKKTLLAEDLIRKAFEAKFPDWQPFEVPVSVVTEFFPKVTVVRILPLSTDLYSPLTGDVDNYSKTVLDALNGAAWLDDRQVYSLLASKKGVISE